MATLGEMVTRITAEMGRGDAATVRRQIVSTIEEHRRKPWYFSERRGAIIELAAGQTWYSQLGFRDPSQATVAQIEAEVDIPDLDLEFSFDDFPTVGRVEDIIRVDWAAVQDDADQRWTLDWVEYRDFEDMNNGTTGTGQPTCWTLWGMQIGVYPAPDKFYRMRVSARVRPLVPAADGDSSIWFDQAEEMIRMGAKKRLARDDYRDMEAYQAFAQAEAAAAARLQAEHNRRRRGRICPSW